MPRFTPAYPPEFRAEAVQLLRIGGKPLAEIAPDLGASAESTAPRGPPAGDRPGPAEGLTTAEREELWRLHRESRILREEREILKKSLRLLRQGDRQDPVVMFLFVTQRK